MRVAMVLLTSGATSGGAAKHFRVLPPLLAQDPRVSALRLFMPQGAMAPPPEGIPVFEWAKGSAAARRRAIRTALEDFGPDVVFIPTARYFATPGAATVVMVRNMEPLLTPFEGNTLIDRVKNVGRRIAAEHACRRADRVIAVSDHVRDFLVDRWSIASDRIGTVYHGVDVPAVVQRPVSLEALGEAPFLFSMGSIRPARGLTDLVDGLADARLPPSLRLVFAGKADRGSEPYLASLRDRAREIGVADRIIWAGQLNPSEVAWCFRHARAFVMTSRAEACPNTVLEALSHGSLSVSGDNPPMPEFFTDAALYYANGDSRSLANSLVELLAQPLAAAQTLRDRARERAAHFTWESCARRTVDELAVAFNRRSR